LPLSWADGSLPATSGAVSAGQRGGGVVSQYADREHPRPILEAVAMLRDAYQANA
jgi:hypothetical protein